MGFLKRNWFVMLAGLAGVGGIALMVVFTGCMAEIETGMGEAVSLYGKLETLAKSPQNKTTIAAVEATTDYVKKEYAQVLESAIRINRKEPLRDDVLPVPTGPDVPFRFKHDYREAFLAMMRELNPNAPEGTTNFDAPNEEELAQWQEEIERRLADEAEQRAAVTGGGRPGASRGRAAAGRRPKAAAANRGTEALSPVEQARGDAEQMAMISKARSLYCYVSLDSFVVHEVYDLNEPFNERDIWAAQMSLWVQQDIVKGIAAVNDHAAAIIAGRNKARTEGAPALRADVSTMPVKHLLSIELLGGDNLYYADSGVGDGGGGGRPAAARTIEAGPTFTGRESNELFDLIRFRVELVVDQPDLPQVIDQIARANFFTPVNVNYEQMTSEEATATGHLYGHEPYVRATLDFEAYYFREAYHYRRPKGGPERPADGETIADADEEEDALENYPFMPEAVREQVVEMGGMAGLHRGFVLSTARPRR